MNKPASIYIHFPFCKSKCSYCTFNSITDLSLKEKYINDLSYINLFSYTYELGRKNVIEMYKSFLDMTKKYNILVGKIAYSKVHRLNNLLDKVNLIDSNKFIKILERGV